MSWIDVARAKSVGFKDAFQVLFTGIPVGIMVGSAVAAYDYVVNTWLWERWSQQLSPEVLCLLPLLGMLLTAVILRIFGVTSRSMADDVVKAYHDPTRSLVTREAGPKLAASIATMGFGASAGMEGASKWLGAVIASWLQAWLNRWRAMRLWHAPVDVMMLVGAAAGISAIFRAPLTGAIMAIESPFKKDLAHEALLHGLVAAAVSYTVFVNLRDGTPYFPIAMTYTVNVRDLVLCVPLGILAGLVSHLFLAALSFFKNIAHKMGKRVGPFWPMNELIGGLGLVALAYGTLRLIGVPATLQAGLPVANRLLNGDFTAEVCLVILVAKLLATAMTFGMGGVGGLFVPSATIGAALGALCDHLLQPSQPGLMTLMGIAAFTGASYNSLLFSVVFIAETAGHPALVVPGLIASSVAFLVSAGVSNSPSQRWHRTEASPS